MVSFILGCFRKKWQTVFLVIAIQASQCMAGMDLEICLVKVQYDGFCFYHAVSRALGQGDNGRPLFQRLSEFLNDASASSHPMLEAHLSDGVVGSSIDILTNQLASVPPSLSNRDSWAGLPELVAMVQMLGQPVLVWHINQNLQVDEHSLLVTTDSIIPAFSIEEGADIAIPAIQLVHAGSEWWLLKTEGSLQPWSLDWEAYRHQVSGVLREQLNADHSEAVLEETDGDEPSQGWVYLPGMGVPENLLILAHNSLEALQEIVVAASLPSLMEAYLYMKLKLKGAVSESDDILDPGFQWTSDRFERVAHQIDRVSRTLVSPVATSVIGNSMNDYLEVTNLRQNDFMASLLPTRCSVWDTLSRFQPLIETLGQRSSGLTFSGIYSTFLASTQESDTTSGINQFDFSEHSFASLPSGRQHPAHISVVQEKVIIPFDTANPLHHILFSLYVSARAFQMVNHCLTLSLMQASDQELTELLEIPQDFFGRAMVESQIKEYEVALKRIRVVIHALGLRYYPQYWQPGRYQAIIICDGRTIVFSSDDAQPRDGWSHLQPPSPEQDEH